MKPVVSSVVVPQPREDVFAFLDALANHEQFTDHMLVDWTLSGPPAGVGARVRLRTKGSRAWADLEVLEVDAPRRSMEETVGAGGRRRTRGIYELEALPDGGTRVTFTFQFLEATALDRALMPFLLRFVRRGNDKAMERLAAVLASRGAATAAS